MSRRVTLGAALAVAAVAAVPAIAPAHGGSGHTGAPPAVSPIADGLAGPLQLAVDRSRTVYVG